jgi:hypothetical protein
MKRIVFASAVSLLAYWGIFQWEQGPQEENSLVEMDFAPREAAVAAIPIKRAPESAPTEQAWIGTTAEETAHRYVEMMREGWGVQTYHDLRSESQESPLGTSFKFSVYQGDYRIHGMEINLRVTNNQEVKDVNFQYRPVPEADVKQQLPATEELIDMVAQRYEPVSENTTALLYVPRNVDDMPPVPAVAMTVKNKKGETVQGIFRATDGQVLDLTKGRLEIRQ